MMTPEDLQEINQRQQSPRCRHCGEERGATARLQAAEAERDQLRRRVAGAEATHGNFRLRIQHIAIVLEEEDKPDKYGFIISTIKSALEEEARFISQRLHDRDSVIVLDRSGKAYDSEALAARIDHLSVSHDRLTFIIGGPLGLSKEVLKRAHETLSLSKLTFTHEIRRLPLLEQLYRASTINNNEKYHK